MNEKMHHIYEKHLLLKEVGHSGQERLLAAKVAVIGAGGLGCPVLQYLAAAGVGTITIIDGDRVSRSNLQRQILYGMDDIGLLKAEISAHRLAKMYPHLQFHAACEHLSPNNGHDLLSAVDLVIDCTDNFAARYLINDLCVQRDIPFVHGAIYKFEGQIAVFNHNGGPTYRCVFPNFPKEGNQPNCSDVGVLGVLPGIIGTMQATEVIKWIVGMDGLLDRHMVSYNAMHHALRKMELPKRNTEICDQIQKETLAWHSDYCVPRETITWRSLLDTKHYSQIVDVRETDEQPEGPEFTTHQIPLSVLEFRFQELDKKLPTAVYCKSGKRSQQAVTWLKNQSFTNVVSIENGIEALESIRIKDEKLF